MNDFLENFPTTCPSSIRGISSDISWPRACEPGPTCAALPPFPHWTVQIGGTGISLCRSSSIGYLSRRSVRTGQRTSLERANYFVSVEQSRRNKPTCRMEPTWRYRMLSIFFRGFMFPCVGGNEKHWHRHDSHLRVETLHPKLKGVHPSSAVVICL